MKRADSTWGTGILHKRLLLVAVKLNGIASDEDMIELHKLTWPKLTDNASMTVRGKTADGKELILLYDVYVVKQLSFFPRLRHSLRMFKAAIAGNHKHTAVREITLE